MRILIAEKNRGFRAEFVELITHCHPSWQIVETGDVAEFRARMTGSRFDVVFLDLHLPGLLATMNLGAMRSDYPHTKIIGLGDTNDSATIIHCFEEGLGGYISRSCSGINLIRTLKVIATPDLFISTGSSEPARSATPDRAATSDRSATLDRSAPLDRADAPAPPVREAALPLRGAEIVVHPLTARQADVLNLLSEGRSTKDIARRLGLAVPTVKTHLAAVYRQLGARNRLQAVVKASALATQSTTFTAMMRGMGQGEMFQRNFAAG
jgi:two-component system, NarL family, nitrate/nitrite response regulator NarL